MTQVTSEEIDVFQTDFSGIRGSAAETVVDGFPLGRPGREVDGDPVGWGINNCRLQKSDNGFQERTSQPQEAQRITEKSGAGRIAVRECPPQHLRRLLFLLVFLLLFFDYQVVGDGECAGDAVGLHAGDLLLHLAGHYAFERDVSAVDDDVNGRNSTQLVLA